ncbi:LANO_0H14356g1_1 [Lachancea nothofagi CBS 11611]|uniref:Genetic interactor of prohibitins 3, mitochondrial n=1 Tax=Lachancea nothofagi CBS 11611 TaxID=1266666 RepID=A0A1G4KMI0_9SACH|nr:LANO_0H14356g1_1 [Lachancea nothofagi CBS 11611]
MFWRLGKLVLKNGAKSIKRFKSCHACGVPLQSRDSLKSGYYTPPKASPVSSKNAQLGDLRELKYLLFSQDLRSLQRPNNTSDFMAEETDHLKPTNKLVCKRCSDALHQNRHNAEDFRPFSAPEVCKHIPKDADVFHILPLAQFPLNFDSGLFLDPTYNASLLLSKGDQVTPDKAVLQRKAPPFFNDFLRTTLGVVSNKAVAFSATQNWNVQSVYSMLRGKSYLLGSPNSGKSTLINALLKRYGGYKYSESVAPREFKSPTNLVLQEGAGVSHIPNMTRNLQTYQIGEKKVNDLPGYSQNVENTPLDTFLEAKVLEKIRKTHLFTKSKLVRQKYTSVKGTDYGRCYTVSGIFYLVPPPGTINQVVNYIPGNEKQYHDIDKALSVAFNELNSNEGGALKQYVGVAKHMGSKDNYVRHVIPPFQGTVEIVMKDIGYFQLKATGKYHFSGLYEIWLPKGIEIIIREPIVRLIEQGFETHLESQGKKSAFPEKRPVFSSTYPMDVNEPDTLTKMKDMFLERTSNDIMSRRLIHHDPMDIVGQLQNNLPNLYWYYKW